jgi:hypothetical protein
MTDAQQQQQQKPIAHVNQDQALKTILGYKIFKGDWTCRKFQFPFGNVQSDAGNFKTAVHHGPVKMCESGFHFCERAVDCLAFYRLDPSFKYAEVAASGIVLTEGNKSVTNHLTLVKELSYHEFKSMCTGIVTLLHPNSQKQVEIPYKEGVKHGELTTWHDDGQVNERTTYVHGCEHGISRSWYPGGQKCCELTFHMGVRHGKCRYWYHDGHKAEERTFVHGKEKNVTYFDKPDLLIDDPCDIMD